MKNSKRNTYIFFTVIVVALMAVIVLLFLNMQRPMTETQEFEKGLNDVQRGVRVEIVPQGGKGGSWIKTIGTGINRGKYTATVFDMNVKSVGLGTVNDWSLRVDIDKFTYLNKAWCGTIEIHQDNEKQVQRLDLRENTKEELIVNSCKEGNEVFIELNPGDYFIYYPDEKAGEVPLNENQGAIAGIILYSRGVGGYRFNHCSITYTVIGNYKNMPGFYLIIVLFGLFLLMLTYFLIVFFQQKRTQVLYEHEKLVAHETMATFVGFVDAKDPYTAGHSERVARYTKLIAEKMGYDEDDCMEAYYCGLLHDAGKISVPESILKKKGALDKQEFEEIKQHTVKGYEILKNLKTVPLAAVAARNHHERYDGTGYPDMMQGQEIPEVARMIGVADAFDAMNSNRVYRNALQREDIITQLEIHKGKQFDPEITDIFLELLKSGAIDRLNNE